MGRADLLVQSEFSSWSGEHRVTVYFRRGKSDTKRSGFQRSIIRKMEDLKLHTCNERQGALARLIKSVGMAW